MTPARNDQTTAIEQALRATASEPADVEAALRHALERADAEGLVDVAWTSTDTPVGPLFLAATDAGLVKVGFGVDDSMLEQLAAQVSPRVVAAPKRLDAVRRELDEYFGGTRETFDVPLDWRLSRGFRRSVLERLHAEVDYGRTVSYLELATMAGNPQASRAVGSAMATNPIPIVVPCHRVLRTGGALGGYAGGLPTKVRLLELESGASSTLF
jgi:methylated-DNA-[protein]-cysteine S-methyltransferase